jgi:predicted TIM-barrel fold metal-dependent hydrolase
MRLNADYSAWLATAKQFMELQSAAERSAIFHDNAIRFYRLPPK